MTNLRVPLIGRRFKFAAALLQRLFGKNPRSHHKGATGRVQTGDQRLPVLYRIQLGQDIPQSVRVSDSHGRAQWQNPCDTKRLLSLLVIRAINRHRKV